MEPRTPIAPGSLAGWGVFAVLLWALVHGWG